MHRDTRTPLTAAAGFSLIELLIAMGLLTVIMGVTLSGLAGVVKGNEVVLTISQMNNALRAGTDLMIRDLLQAGSGLPTSHTVAIPSGNGAQRVNLPGPPGSAFQTAATDLVLPAVIPGDGAGPTINGVATDVLTVLMADNSFMEINLTGVADSSVVVAAGPDLANGADRVMPGQLMLISKGSFNTLVQVTAVDNAARRLTFADNDSLKLNQSQAENGTLKALNAEDPVDDAATNGVNEAAAASRISRMRMITYYIDSVTDPNHPRLVRRVNNGDATTFSNTLGTAVALDIFNLQFTFDINNGAGNPGGVSMTAADMAGGGACGATACGATQIRKVNLSATARADQETGSMRYLTSTLVSQVSLRAMAFVDRYR
jgi:type II secretory pathway pseudopilin PulG